MIQWFRAHRPFVNKGLQQVGILLFYTFLTGLLLYPLPLHLATGLLEADAGDPLMQIWVVQWNIQKLLSGSLTNYFDANIFYPYTNTFAYHDHLFGLGLLGLPIYWLSQNPILTYNLLLMLSFILSAYGMYVLVRELTHHSCGAFLAGLMFGFLPYRFAHIAHLNLLSIQWLPFCLLFLTRVLFSGVGIIRRKSWRYMLRNGLLFWGCFLLQTLTSFNYLFMLAFIVGVYGVAMLGVQLVIFRHLLIRKRSIGVLILGGCLVGWLLLPFVRPYLKANQEMGFERTIRETEGFSARPQDYLVAPEQNLLYGRLTRTLQSATARFPEERMLFPGVLALLLGGIGIVTLWTFPHQLTTPPQPDGLVVRPFTLGGGSAAETSRVLRVSALILLMVGFILSFGPSITLFGKLIPLPYASLFKYLPGFKSMRVPARFGLLAEFALAILAAFGVAQLYAWFNRGKRAGRRFRFNMVTTAVLAGLMILEYWSSSWSITSYPAARAAIPEVYQWLSSQPDDLRLIELPVNSARDDFEYTYYATFHWKRMVNGRSAFIPNGINMVLDAMQEFPSSETIALLTSLGVNTVIVHQDRLTEALPQTLPDGLRVIAAFGTDLVLGISQPDASGRATQVDLHYQIPAQLRPGERYTLGASLNTVDHRPFSPLPIEHAAIQLTWMNGVQLVHHETRRLALPIVVQPDRPVTQPFSITTPPYLGAYQLQIRIAPEIAAPSAAIQAVTLSSDVLDSRQPGRLEAQVIRVAIPETWPAGQALPVHVVARNTGDTLWLANVQNRARPSGEVHLGVVAWYDAITGKPLPDQSAFQKSRGFLRQDVGPGQEAAIKMTIRTPEIPGAYLVELDLVSELVQWFAKGGVPLLKRHVVLN